MFPVYFVPSLILHAALVLFFQKRGVDLPIQSIAAMTAPISLAPLVVASLFGRLTNQPFLIAESDFVFSYFATCSSLALVSNKVNLYAVALFGLWCVWIILSSPRDSLTHKVVLIWSLRSYLANSGFGDFNQFVLYAAFAGSLASVTEHIWSSPGTLESCLFAALIPYAFRVDSLGITPAHILLLPPSGEGLKVKNE